MRSNYTYFLFVFVCSFFIQTVAHHAHAQEARTWKSADGRFTVQAKIVGLKAGKASLQKADGKVVEVDMSLLSKADKDYVEGLRKAQAKRKQPQQQPQDNSQTLSIPGVFSINSPGHGFAWNTGGERVVNGVQAYRLGCSKIGSTATVTLIVTIQKGDTDEKRALLMKSNYQALMDKLEQGKVTNVQRTPLKLDSPIPSRVEFDFSGQTPNNTPVAIRIVNIFKENTYSFQINGTNKADLDQLATVIDTLKEIGTTPTPTGLQETDGRFRHATYGFSYKPPSDLSLVDKPQPGVVALFGSPSGANVFFRCIGKSDDFNLEKMFADLKTKETDSALEGFKSLGNGDLQMPGRICKFRSFAYTAQETPLKVVQYYFTSKNWIYVVTATTKEVDFDNYRESFDASIKDVKFF